MSDLSFSDLAITRFAHDMAGPIAAINNGLELMALDDDPEHQEQVIAILVDSAKEAIARLQFFRAAFGRYEAESRSKWTEVESLTRAFFASSKIKLQWSDDTSTQTEDPYINHLERRLWLNGILTMSQLLGLGGTLTIHAQTDALLHIEVQTDHQLTMVEAVNILQHDSPKLGTDPAPKEVPAYILRQTAEQKEYALDIIIDEANGRGALIIQY